MFQICSEYTSRSTNMQILDTHIVYTHNSNMEYVNMAKPGELIRILGEIRCQKVSNLDIKKKNNIVQCPISSDFGS